MLIECTASPSQMLAQSITTSIEQVHEQDSQAKLALFYACALLVFHFRSLPIAAFGRSQCSFLAKICKSIGTFALVS